MIAVVEVWISGVKSKNGKKRVLRTKKLMVAFNGLVIVC